MDFIKNTRGFRNNNVGNIRVGNSNWKGKVSGDDFDFESFSAVEYGIRAIYKLLDTYQKKYDIVTIQDIIRRYAPSSENDTNSYIQSVCHHIKQYTWLEVSPSTKIDSAQLRTIFIAGIINHENGQQPFNINFIKQCEKL